jgi:uncharacterized RDD family membrane protein YckC
VTTSPAGPTGPGTASWGRRLLALLVDWLACLALAEGLVAAGVLPGNPGSIWTLVVFVAETAVLTALAGGSFGKLATRLRVVNMSGDGRPPNLLRSLLRSVLVALVIPPLVFKPDRRGLHDLAAGTATVPLTVSAR